MSGQFSNGSIWQFPDQFYVWTAGAYAEADEAYTWDDGENEWVQIFPNIVEVTVANSTNVVAQNLFTVDDWAAPSTKKVIIPSGVVVGSSTISLAALRVGTGAGGPVVFEIGGEIQGAGGAANGGAGGTAIHADAACEILLTGAIRGGGGGGGAGGAGGGGYYQTAEDSGWQYSTSPTTYVYGTYNQYKAFWWYGSWLGQSAGNPASLNSGGYTYHMGVVRSYNGDGNANSYEIKRTRTLTHYTSGGAGGAGGQGQGYNQSAASGSGGAAGGTNAGAGGTGGNGATWGTNAANGATGASGNNGGGAAGGTGGAAGTAIHGISNVTLTNNGTINGAQIA
jgi:hypothetical protein